MQIGNRGSIEPLKMGYSNAASPADTVKLKENEIKATKVEIKKVEAEIKSEKKTLQEKYNPSGFDKLVELESKMKELKSQERVLKFELSHAKNDYTKTSIFRDLFNSLKRMFSSRQTTTWTPDAETATKTPTTKEENLKPAEPPVLKENTVAIGAQRRAPMPLPPKLEPEKLAKPAQEAKPAEPEKADLTAMAEKLFSKLPSPKSAGMPELPEIPQDKQVNVSKETKTSPEEKIQEIKDLIGKVEVKSKQSQDVYEKKVFGNKLKELNQLLTDHTKNAEKLTDLSNEIVKLKENFTIYEDIAQKFPSPDNQSMAATIKGQLESKENEFNNVHASINKTDLSNMAKVSPEEIIKAKNVNNELRLAFNALNEEFKGKETSGNVALLQRYLREGDHPISANLNNIYLVPPEKRSKELLKRDLDEIENEGLKGVFKGNPPQAELDFMEGFQAFKGEQEALEKENLAAANLSKSEDIARANQKIEGNKGEVLEYLSKIKDDLKNSSGQAEYNAKANKYKFVNAAELYSKDKPDTDMIKDKVMFIKFFNAYQEANAKKYDKY